MKAKPDRRRGPLLRASRLASLIACALGGASVGGTAQTAGTPVAAPFELIKPDRERSELSSSYFEIVQAQVWQNVLDRKVLLQWRRRFPDGHLKFSIQQERVSFWPTHSTGFGDDRVAVGGKTIKGKTIVRVWEFSSSEVLPSPTWDPVQQRWEYPSTLLPIESDYRAYIGEEAGKNGIRMLMPNLGSTDRLIVWFDDSRDLYELDVNTESLYPLLSASAGGPAEHQPALATDYLDVLYGDHPSLGYIYLMMTSYGPHLRPYLLLRDSDKDGVLDAGASQVVDHAQYEALGLEHVSPR